MPKSLVLIISMLLSIALGIGISIAIHVGLNIETCLVLIVIAGLLGLSTYRVHQMW